MKKLLTTLLLISALLLCFVSVCAESADAPLTGTCDSFSWTLAGNDLTVTGEHFVSSDLPENVQSQTQVLIIGAGIDEVEYGYNTLPNITSIQVTNENTEYSVLDGVLFRDNGEILCLFPSARTGSYTVPEGVISLGYFSFIGSQLSAIELPDSLQYIDSNAIQHCPNLTSITIPANVVEIDRNFAFCDSLTNIYVDTANSVYRDDNGMLYLKDSNTLYVYPAGRNDTDITITGTSIAHSAFRWNQTVTSITLAEGIYEIGQFAFANSAIENIHLPISLQTINECTFYKTALSEIHYAGTVNQWSNVQINKANDVLYKMPIHCSDGTAYIDHVSGTIGVENEITYSLTLDGTLTISGAGQWNGGAFSGDTTVATVYLESGVSEIPGYAFYECTNLHRIYIPSSVLTIYDYAISECNSLTDIYYSGTQEQWNSIEIWEGNDIINNLLNSGHLHFKSSILAMPFISKLQHGTQIGTDISAHITGPEDAVSVFVEIGTLDYEGNFNPQFQEFYDPKGADILLLGVYTQQEGTYAIHATAYTHDSYSDDPEETANDSETAVVTFDLASGQLPPPVEITISGYDRTSDEYPYELDLADHPQPSISYSIPGADAVAYSWSVTNPVSGSYLGGTGMPEKFTEGETGEVILEAGPGFYYTNFYQRVGGVWSYVNGVGVLLNPLGGFLPKPEIAYGNHLIDEDVSVFIGDPMGFTINVENADTILYELNKEGSVVYSGSSAGPQVSLDLAAYITSAADYALAVSASTPDWVGSSESIMIHAVTVETQASGTCGANGDNLTWTLDSNGLLSISGTGSFNTEGIPAEFYQDVVKVYYGSGVTDIPPSEFSYWYKLTEFAVDPENPNYTAVDGVLYNRAKTALIECPTAKTGTLTIPEGVIIIEDDAFIGSFLSSVTLPSSLETIGDQAFWNSKITEITLPEHYSNYQASVFNGCDYLTAFHVSTNNPNYAAENGILYSKDKTTLIRVPGGYSGSLTTIPGITAIYASAFQRCESLTAVTLSEGIKAIGNDAFADSGVQSVFLPRSLTTIDTDAFKYADHLTHVEYAGTTEEWSMVSISAGNDLLLFNTIHCTDGDIASQPLTGSIGDGIAYSLTSDGTLTVSGAGTWENMAFLENQQIIHVVLSEGVTEIGEFAFQGCQNLVDIRIPVSVKRICLGAFEGFNSPIDIYYAGTEEDFNSIIIEVGNDILSSAVVHYLGEQQLPAPTISVAPSTRRQDLTISVAGPENAEAIDVILEAQNVTELYSETISGSSGEFTVPGWYTTDDFTYVVTAVARITGESGEEDWIYGEEAVYTFTLPAPAQPEPTVPDHMTFSAREGISGEISMTVEGADAIAYTSFFEGMGGGRPDEFTEGDTVYLSAETDENGDYAYGSYEISCYARFGDLWYDIGNDWVTILSPDACGKNLVWSLENGVLTISGTGAMYDYSDNNPAPWQDSIGDISAIVLGSGVTSIGDRAFPDARALTSVTIPGTVTEIGAAAFVGCRQLAQLIIPEGVTSIGESAFYLCHSLTSLILPSQMTSIGRGAFENTGITSVTIPNGITTISADTFMNCQNLTSITIPSSVTRIEECAFIGSPVQTVNVPAGVKTTAHYFYCMYEDGEGENYTLHRVNLPDSVTHIGQWAFYGSDLPKVNPGFVTPRALSTIESEAFYGISASYVYLSDNVRSIGSDAFAGCPNLAFVRIPMSCTSIATDAFPAGTTLLVPYEYNTDALSGLTGVTVKVAEFYGGNG